MFGIVRLIFCTWNKLSFNIYDFAGAVYVKIME